jgi:hypothetical protein
MWPTPRASEYKGCGPIESKGAEHMEKKQYLCAIAQESEGISGQLSADWTELLMGFPKGWTECYMLGAKVGKKGLQELQSGKKIGLFVLSKWEMRSFPNLSRYWAKLLWKRKKHG